jgi:predicted metal-dependent peptidase
MFNTELTAEQRLQKAVAQIMRHDDYMTMQGLLAIGSREVSDDIPTACTNGRDEWYGTGWIDSINDAELRYTILHENYHKGLKHLDTWHNLYKEDPELANMACDYVINNKLNEEERERRLNPPFISMPKGGLADDRFLNMNAGQVFRLLQQDRRDGKPTPQGSGLDEHDWDGAKELTDAEIKELKQDVDQAIRQGAMLAGKMGKGADRLFTDSALPQVDWREVLRDFINTTCAGDDLATWRRPNRKYMDYAYMPSTYSERVGELVEGADMSASMDEVMPIIRAETKQILDVVKPEQLRVMYWDTEVCGDETYDANNMDMYESLTKPKGGGGTRPKCVPEYMAEQSIRPQAAIMITDGHISGGWGAWTCPVLWIIIDNKHATPDCGKVVHIDSNQL